METLWSIIKTLVVTVVVVLALQIQVGGRTLESRLLIQIRSWSKSMPLEQYGELTQLTIRRAWLNARLKVTQMINPEEDNVTEAAQGVRSP